MRKHVAELLDEQAAAASGTNVGRADTIGTTSNPGDLSGLDETFTHTVIAWGFWAVGNGGGGVFYGSADTTTADDGD